MPLKKGHKRLQNLGGYYTPPSRTRKRSAPDSSIVVGSEEANPSADLSESIDGSPLAKRARTSPEPPLSPVGSHFPNAPDLYTYAPVNMNIHEHHDESLPPYISDNASSSAADRDSFSTTAPLALESSPAIPPDTPPHDWLQDSIFTESFEVDGRDRLDDERDLLSFDDQDSEEVFSLTDFEDSDSEPDNEPDPSHNSEPGHSLSPPGSLPISISPPLSEPTPLSLEDRRCARAARIAELEARRPPTLSEVNSALQDLHTHLYPPRTRAGADPSKPDGGQGYKTPSISRFQLVRINAIQAFLTNYQYHLTNSDPDKHYWMAASRETAEQFSGKHESWAKLLRKWGKTYVRERQLPSNPYGKWRTAGLLQDEALAQELSLHLQSIGKYIRAQDLVDYLAREEVQARWGLKKTISLSTAKRWMRLLGYRWRLEPKGQYADGHERGDVVQYRQTVFVPEWTRLEGQMRNWSADGTEEDPKPPGSPRNIVVYHDESIFHENDRRKLVWWHESESAKPYKKGEGASLMVADFFSPDFGWLRSRDGTQSARVLFRPGAGRDGYFTSDEILEQAETAMDIMDGLKQDPQYANDSFTAVYDNAKTHTKRAEDAPSARKCPKGIPKDGSNWGVEVSRRDESGKIIYRIGADGKRKAEKVKVPMRGARFSDGREQPLYFPSNHPSHPGKFKGMARILEERGYGDMSKVLAECKGFKCPPGSTRCCCRRRLFNEPDFVNVESLLEAAYRARGYKVLFLPKFHCELNPIEQCWGISKADYRVNPPSSGEQALEKNVVKALDKVTLIQMRRFSNRSRKFVDAYRKGLDGKQAAWAGKKYHSHRVLPASLMADLDQAKL